jgi:hypothetical protein
MSDADGVGVLGSFYQLSPIPFICNLTAFCVLGRLFDLQVAADTAMLKRMAVSIDI